MRPHYAGGTPAEKFKDQDRILGALDGVNWTTTLDLAETLGIDRQKLFNRLQRMKRRNLVIKQPVTADGRNQAAWRKTVTPDRAALKGWGW